MDLGLPVFIARPREKWNMVKTITVMNEIPCLHGTRHLFGKMIVGSQYILLQNMFWSLAKDRNDIEWDGKKE